MYIYIYIVLCVCVLFIYLSIDLSIHLLLYIRVYVRDRLPKNVALRGVDCTCNHKMPYQSESSTTPVEVTPHMLELTHNHNAKGYQIYPNLTHGFFLSGLRSGGG